MGYYILGLYLAFCFGFATCSIFSATKIALMRRRLDKYEGKHNRLVPEED